MYRPQVSSYLVLYLFARILIYLFTNFIYLLLEGAEHPHSCVCAWNVYRPRIQSLPLWPPRHPHQLQLLPPPQYSRRRLQQPPQYVCVHVRLTYYGVQTYVHQSRQYHNLQSHHLQSSCIILVTSLHCGAVCKTKLMLIVLLSPFICRHLKIDTPTQCRVGRPRHFAHHSLLRH